MTSPTTSSTTPTDTDDNNDREEEEVIVTRVETEQDWIAFADLRYEEWMVPLGTTGSSSSSSHNSSPVPTVPSRQAFRCATRDIYLEDRPRSLLVLAKRRRRRKQQRDKHQPEENPDEDEDEEMVVLGGAEWSPYEVEAGLVLPSTTMKESSSSSFSLGYVTDVVTAVPYRKQGIGRLIMTTLETLAVTLATTTTPTTMDEPPQQPPTTHFLLLHVHPDNTSALRFYRQQLGYTTVLSSELEKCLDVRKLEKEAGTEGQILLVKKLVTE